MPKSLKNDIALLLLDRPLEISEHINVICMPEQEEVFDSSKNCVANGWGKKNFGELAKIFGTRFLFARCKRTEKNQVQKL